MKEKKKFTGTITYCKGSTSQFFSEWLKFQLINCLSSSRLSKRSLATNLTTFSQINTAFIGEIKEKYKFNFLFGEIKLQFHSHANKYNF